MSAAPHFATLHQLPAPEQWISAEYVQQLTGWSARWLREQVEQGRVRGRETSTRLPNGRLAKEYALSSLPVDARERYAAEQARLAPATAQQELALFGGPHLVAAPRVRAPKGKETEVEAKHRILQPVLDMRIEHIRHIYAASLKLRDGRPVNSLNRMIAYQIEQEADRGHTLTSRTIKRWLAAHKAEGDAGLAKRRRRDAGRSRYFEQPEHRKAGVLVASLYLGDGFHTALSPQACHDMLVAQRELVGLREDDLPHYSTVRTFLARSSAALRVYARSGRKDFAERMLPYLSRAYTEAANAIWVSDTMIADVEVMNDCFDGAEMGTPIRLRLTAIIDYRSRLVVGYAWCWEGSSASIATALREAVSQHGPCELFYVDNGKDFRKVARGAVHGFEREAVAEEWKEDEYRRIDSTGVLARLGIRVTHCLPHHPQSKNIERFFRTVHLHFCKVWHTYTGGKPSERPDQTTALMALHRRSLRHGDLSVSQHPLASDFMQRFAAWLEIYHHHRHSGRGMQGRSPAEVFRAERNPKQKPAPRPEDLAWLLWEHKSALVRECQVRVNNQDYAPRDILQSRLMLDRNETRVTVAFDPLDPRSVAVLDVDGRLVTMLDAKRLVRQAPHDPETQRQIAAMQQTRGALTKDLKQQRTAITIAGKQLGVVHPVDLLATSPAKPDAAAVPVVLDSIPVAQRKPRFKPEPTTHAPKYAHDLVASVLGRKENR